MHIEFMFTREERISLVLDEDHKEALAAHLELTRVEFDQATEDGDLDRYTDDILAWLDESPGLTDAMSSEFDSFENLDIDVSI